MKLMFQTIFFEDVIYLFIYFCICVRALADEDMGNCPIRTQLRINGICQCPREYPKRDGGFCCAYDFDGVKNCICPHGYVFRRNTREICRKYLHLRAIDLSVDVSF